MRSCDINSKVLFHHYSRDKKGTQKLAALVYVYINSISILPCISDGKRKMIFVLIILNMGTQLSSDTSRSFIGRFFICSEDTIWYLPFDSPRRAVRKRAAVPALPTSISASFFGILPPKPVIVIFFYPHPPKPEIPDESVHL